MVVGLSLAGAAAVAQTLATYNSARPAQRIEYGQ